jgi:methionyl-tRNA formyltransferase
MMNQSKTVVFFGTDAFSAPALQGLIEAGYSIGAVVTKPDSKQGRGQQLTAPLVKQIALEHNIPVLQPTNLLDIADDIKKLGDVVGVLVSYGKIIPQSIIDLFTPGIINVHPSLLPKYRGSTPIETAIANGDSMTGISIMQLVAKMDAGPVYGYTNVELNGTETQAELYTSMAEESTNVLLKILPGILDGSCTTLPQDEKNATYTKQLSKVDAVISQSDHTAEEAERLIRAHLIFPKTKMTIAGHQVVVTKAHVSDSEPSALTLPFASNTYLVIDELIAPSGRTMSGKDFLNGYAAD